MYTQNQIKISEALLTECNKPVLLTTDTMEELVNVLLENSKELGLCYNKHKALIKQIRQIEAYESK